MQDILLTEERGLKFLNGDFYVGNSNSQSVELLLTSKQGEWKQHPEAGCNIGAAVNGVIDRFLERNVRVQLEADGFNIEQLKIDESGITLKGDYD
ncbi:MAG: hypothetical protein E2590_12860 [Chryseobacterium sp.]|nr:hypothetical protein [Chryseobacterium sp.]